MIKKTWPFYISFFLLILVGCQNGCTTQSTMKRESVIMKRNGEKILIVAKLLDFRNSRRKYSNRIFPRQISHSYGIEFEVSGLGLKNLHFYSEDVDDPDNVDLDKYLKQVKVSLSKDKYHLAVGYKDELIKVFHLFKGKEINSMYLNDTGSTSWKYLNINGYPTPKELILKELGENCNFSIYLEENVKNLFEDLKPSDSAHVILLDNWPECSVAKEYYKGQILKKLVRNKVWKSYAIARAEEVYNSRLYSNYNQDCVTFFEALNSEKLNNLIESAVVDNWNVDSDWQLTDYIIKDVQRGGNKISAKNREIIFNDAQSILNQFLDKGNVSYTRYPEKCLAITLAFRDTTIAYQVLEEGMLNKKSKLNAGTTVKVLFKNEALLTPYQRNLLNKNIEPFFKKLSADDKEDVFREINNFDKCRLLRKWKNEYPEELKFAFISFQC